MSRLDRIERAHAIAWDDDETSWLILHAAIPGLLAIARAVAANEHACLRGPRSERCAACAALADFEAAS